MPSGRRLSWSVAHLDPAASQKMNLFRMTEKFPDLGSEEQLATKVERAPRRRARRHGLDARGPRLGRRRGRRLRRRRARASPSYARDGRERRRRRGGVARCRRCATRRARRTLVDRRRDRGVGAGNERPAGDGDRRSTSSCSQRAPNAMQSVIDHRQRGDADRGRRHVHQGDGPASRGQPRVRLRERRVDRVQLRAASPSSMTGLPGDPSSSTPYQARGYSVSAESDGLAIDGVTVTTTRRKLTQRSATTLRRRRAQPAARARAGRRVSRSWRLRRDRVGSSSTPSSRSRNSIRAPRAEIERWDLLGPQRSPHPSDR